MANLDSEQQQIAQEGKKAFIEGFRQTALIPHFQLIEPINMGYVYRFGDKSKISDRAFAAQIDTGGTALMYTSSVGDDGVHMYIGYSPRIDDHCLLIMSMLAANLITDEWARTLSNYVPQASISYPTANQDLIRLFFSGSANTRNLPRQLVLEMNLTGQHTGLLPIKGMFQHKAIEGRLREQNRGHLFAAFSQVMSRHFTHKTIKGEFYEEFASSELD